MKVNLPRPTDEDWENALSHLTHRGVARPSLEAAYQEYRIDKHSPQPHHSWKDIYKSTASVSVSKLIKQMKRQGADPFEPNNPDWLQDAARLLEQVRARARLRMVLHKPLSRLERLISRLCNVWAADGREVQVTRALVDFVLDALEPVHPLGAKQVTRLLSAEVRRRIVLAGQGQLRVDTQVVRGTRFAEKSDSVSRQT